MPSNRVQQITQLLAAVNPIAAAAVPLVISVFNSIKALTGGSDRELTEDEKKQVLAEAKASLAEFEREHDKAYTKVHNWIDTHPPTE